MELDLSSSISLHPHAFRTQSETANHPNRLSRGQSPAPMSRVGANSTAVETADGGDDAAIARHPHPSTDAEAESQRAGHFPLVGVGNDPYGLSQRYKTESELAAIKANTSRKRDSAQASSGSNNKSSRSKANSNFSRYMKPFGRSATKARQLHGFYEAQNGQIERMLKSVEEHRADAEQEAGDDHLKFQIAVWGSLAANIILSVVQLYAAISSGSLSLFTTMADSIFDPLSNITLILTNRAVKRVDPNRFPSGKARLETVGNIVFCFLMVTVSMIIISFACRELAKHSGDDLKNFYLPSIVSVCAAFATKFTLFLYTWGIKDKYSQVRILWEDHRNDLLINGFGILTSVGGSKLIWWIDPAGAIFLSVVITGLWLRTAFTEFLLLVGVVASVEVQQLITYVCVTHSPAIKQIDTVRAYHSGPRLIAEVDVVMDPGATLQETHDIAEELQIKLEQLPDIERAYVHVDYETTHKPEHGFKKDV